MPEMKIITDAPISIPHVSAEDALPELGIIMIPKKEYMGYIGILQQNPNCSDMYRVAWVNGAYRSVYEMFDKIFMTFRSTHTFYQLT